MWASAREAKHTAPSPPKGHPEDLLLSPWPWAPQTPWAPQKDKWLMLRSDQDQKPQHPTHSPWGWVQAVSTALCAAPFPRLRCGLPCPALPQNDLISTSVKSPFSSKATLTGPGGHEFGDDTIQPSIPPTFRRKWETDVDLSMDREQRPRSWPPSMTQREACHKANVSWVPS